MGVVLHPPVGQLCIWLVVVLCIGVRNTSVSLGKKQLSLVDPVLTQDLLAH